MASVPSGGSLAAASPGAASLATDSQFIARLVIYSFSLRLVIVLLLQATDAIYILRLSPDSERYHRVGIEIATQMAMGSWNSMGWIDNGWFQFTGLIYYLIGPIDWAMQLINISLGVAIIPLGYRIFSQCTDDVIAARFYAILLAFFPSLVYWSCLMLKDAVSTLAVVLVVFSVFEMRIRPAFRLAFPFATGLLILLGTREYLFTVLILLTPPALLLFPLLRKQSTPLVLILAIMAAGAFPMLLGQGFFASDYLLHSRYFDLEYINRTRIAMGDHGSGALFAQDNVHVWGESVAGDIEAVLVTLSAILMPVNPFALASVRQLIAVPFVVIMVASLWPMARGVMYGWRIRQLSTPIGVITGGVLAVYVGGTTNAGALFRWTTQLMPFLLMAVAAGLFYRTDRLGYRLGVRVVALVP